MNPVCSICSETFKAQEDVVATHCGHCFHRMCLLNWIASSQSCPTCRSVTRSSSLVKLYFETDDNNTSILNLDEILKTNDDLTKNLREEKEKSVKHEAEYLLLVGQNRELKKKFNDLERENQTNKANIEGLRGLREELSMQVIKSQEDKNTLKFDLLAERQLRRTLQKKLNELQPNDDNYKIETIDEGSLNSQGVVQNGDAPPYESTSAMSNGSSSILRRLRCEIELIPKDGNAKNDNQKSNRNYILPNKLIRGTNLKNDAKTPMKNLLTNGRKSVNMKKTLFTNSADRPKGYAFLPATSFDRASSQQPSTSNGITAQVVPPHNNIFGSISVKERDFKDLSTVSISSSPNIFSPNRAGDSSFLNLSTPTGSFNFSAYRTTNSANNSIMSVTSSPFAVASNANGNSEGPKESER